MISRRKEEDSQHLLRLMCKSFTAEVSNMLFDEELEMGTTMVKRRRSGQIFDIKMIHRCTRIRRHDSRAVIVTIFYAANMV